jgi:hypothetical protein
VGDINTYQVFAGLVRQIVGPQGRVGIIVPSGIATDYYNQDYFSTIVEERELVSFYDFENRKGLFPGTHRQYKFCLLTLTGSESHQADYAFFLHATDDLADSARRFALTREDLATMNPNTRTSPILRTRTDADLLLKIYHRLPVLVDESTSENPWSVDLLSMFHMSNDSHLFYTKKELQSEACRLEGNTFRQGKQAFLPLYEAKMIWQFDHRFGTYENQESRSNVHLPTPSGAQHSDPSFLAQPWYWVHAKELDKRIGSTSAYIAYRKVTGATNSRTFVCTVLHRVPLGESAWIIVPEEDHYSCLVGNLNAMVFDYVTRQKLGGFNISFSVLKQLPVVPPNRYTPELLNFIVPRIVELTYTAWDLQPFARDVLDEVGEETWARWFAMVHL